MLEPPKRAPEDLGSPLLFHGTSFQLSWTNWGQLNSKAFVGRNYSKGCTWAKLTKPCLGHRAWQTCANFIAHCATQLRRPMFATYNKLVRSFWRDKLAMIFGVDGLADLTEDGPSMSSKDSALPKVSILRRWAECF